MSRYTVLPLFFLLYYVSSYAQKETYDITYLQERIIEKRQIQDPIRRDSQLIWQYNYISEELARHQDVRTELYLDTLKSLVDNSDWKSADAFYYRAMGRYHDFRGEYSEAILYYEKAINAYIPAGGELKELAFSFVLKAFVLGNAGMYDEAKATIEKGLPYARAAKGKNSLCLLLDWYGDYHYYGMEGIVDNDKALEYYLQVNEILPQISYQRIIADNYAVLSGVYDRKGNKAKADEYFQIADSLCLEHQLPFVRWGLYAEKARQLEEAGNYRAANDIYLFTAAFTKNETNVTLKSRVEKALYENYKRLGEDANALPHLEQLNKYDSLKNINQLEQRYAEIEAKYNIALKENEIAQLESQKAAINRNFLIGLTGILLLAGGMIYRKNRDLSNSHTRLEAKQDEVEQALYQGETQERQRLASELHDNVNTKLAAARWQLEAVADDLEGPSSEVVNMTIKLMNEAYQDVRNISHNLVPTLLSEEGLIVAIRNLITKLNSTNYVVFTLDTVDIDEARLEKVSYPIYNIIFELINNVMKHADATASEISLTQSREQLRIVIYDNGKGFDTVAVQPGFGLKSIKSRVYALSGRLDIASGENGGTTITVYIPIS